MSADRARDLEVIVRPLPFQDRQDLFNKVLHALAVHYIETAQKQDILCVGNIPFRLWHALPDGTHAYGLRHDAAEKVFLFLLDCHHPVRALQSSGFFFPGQRKLIVLVAHGLIHLPLERESVDRIHNLYCSLRYGKQRP